MNVTRNESQGRRVRVAVIGLIAVLCMALAPSIAAANADGDMAKDAGIGLGSAFCSLIYTPVKILYSAGGLVVGGLAYAFSGGDASVARTVLVPSALGDYVVTTEHLNGTRKLEFFGRERAYREEYQAAKPGSEVAAAPDGW